MSKRKLGSIVLSLIVWICILSLALESVIYFREFESPGEAYEYKCKSAEYQVIEGEKTACVAGNEENLYLIRKGQK